MEFDHEKPHIRDNRGWLLILFLLAAALIFPAFTIKVMGSATSLSSAPVFPDDLSKDHPHAPETLSHQGSPYGNPPVS